MGDITLQEALDEYKNVYMAYRNFAERTREEYQNDLEGFIEFIEKSGVDRARDISLPIIERFVADLEHRGFASLTRKRRVVSVRSFLLFLYQDGYIEVNIAKKIILPYTESTTPNILTQVECQRLREACTDNPRDKAIIELLLQTGIKLSEITRLSLNDIDFQGLGEGGGAIIRVKGGRGKNDRLIPLNLSACNVLKVYLNIRKENGNPFLFLNRFGNSLGERGIQKILKTRFAEAGISKGSVHTLRHTFSAMHIAFGKSPKTIQRELGLKDIRSVSVYQSFATEVGSREYQ